MKIRAFLTAAAVSAVLFLASCDAVVFFSGDSLIRAPRLTGEYALLQSAFEDAAGHGTVPVVPVSGEYRSSYVLTDMDGDGTDEAIVFYSRLQSDGAVHMNFLCRENSGWKSVGDITGNGSGVYELSLCDCNGDGNKEFSVEWSLSDSGAADKTLTVYSVFDSSGSCSGITPLASVQTNGYLFFDFDRNGTDELFYTCRPLRDGGTMYAQLLSFGGGAELPVPVTRVDFPKNARATENIICEKNGKKTTRIFADYLTENGRYATLVLDYGIDEAAFSEPLKGIPAENGDPTERNGAVFCRDINEDGVTEIPCGLELAGSLRGKKAGKTEAETVEWCVPFNGGLKGLTKYFINYSDGYRMCIDKLYDISEIRYDPASGTARWYAADENDSEHTILFSVIRSSVNTDADAKDGLLVVVTSDGKEMKIKPSMVKALIETD